MMSQTQTLQKFEVHSDSVNSVQNVLAKHISRSIFVSMIHTDALKLMDIQKVFWKNLKY